MSLQTFWPAGRDGWARQLVEPRSCLLYTYRFNNTSFTLLLFLSYANIQGDTRTVTPYQSAYKMYIYIYIYIYIYYYIYIYS